MRTGRASEQMALVASAGVNDMARFKGFVAVIERPGACGVGLEGEVMCGHWLFANAINFVKMALLE